MTITLTGITISAIVVLFYCIVNGIKKKKLPNLAIVLFLFFTGPTVGEAIYIISVIKQVVWDKSIVSLGVFDGHLYPIGFAAIAMLISVYYTLHQTLSPVFNDEKP